jgi:hypothetical protein
MEKRKVRVPDLLSAANEIEERLKASGVVLSPEQLEAVLKAAQEGKAAHSAANPGARTSAIPREIADASADGLLQAGRELLDVLRNVDASDVLDGARISLTAVASGGRYTVAVQTTTPGIRESGRMGETAEGDSVDSEDDFNALVESMKGNRGRRARREEEEAASANA